MEIFMPEETRTLFAAIVDIHQADAFLRILNDWAYRETGRDFELFQVSKEWATGPFLMKAKGVHGDLLVTFG